MFVDLQFCLIVPRRGQLLQSWWSVLQMISFPNVQGNVLGNTMQPTPQRRLLEDLIDFCGQQQERSLEGVLRILETPGLTINCGYPRSTRPSAIPQPQATNPRLGSFVGTSTFSIKQTTPFLFPDPVAVASLHRLR
jgi:hypothetical protein